MTLSHFRHHRDYRGGTDADHLPEIPGNNFPSDSSPQKEFPL